MPKTSRVNAQVNPGAGSNPFVNIPRAGRSVLLGVAAAYACLLVLGPLFSSGARESFVLLAISSGFYLMCLFYPVASSRNYGWFHPLVFISLFTFINLVFRKTGLLMFGMEEHIALPDKSPYELAQLMAYENFVNSIALLATYIGFHLGPNFQFARLTFGRPRRLAAMVVGSIGISMAALSMYVQVSGDAYTHLLNLARGSTAREFVEETLGVGQYEILLTMSVYAIMIWLACRPADVKNPIFMVAALIALSLSFMATGRRSALVYPSIMGLMVWMLRQRKFAYFRVVLGLAVVVFMFGVGAIWRQTVWKSQNVARDFMADYSAQDVVVLGLEEIQARSGGSASVYPVLAYVPYDEPFLYGRSYIENFLRFIPRTFWPTKPRGIDVLAAERFYGVNWAMPLGPVGEAYWNLHIAGVIVVFFLYGVFCKGLARLFTAHPHEPAVVVFYVVSLFLFVPCQSGFKNWLFAIVPAVGMMWMAGCGVRRSGHAASAAPGWRGTASTT